MSLNSLYHDGITKIWKEHADEQKKFLEIISRCRDMSSDVICDIGAFFVPNDDYMAIMFGPEIRDAQYGCYLSRNYCFWNNCLVTPIVNVIGEVQGFVGFNPFRYLESKETGDRTINYYTYSSKEVFDKGKYLYYKNGIYEKALEEGYLLLVDGFFDAVSLTAAGYNAAAMLGSVVTTEILTQLRFIRRVILICDNDEAGITLYSNLRKSLPRLELFKQGLTKDVDELLKTDYRKKFLNLLDGVLQEPNGVIHLASFS